MVSLDHFEYVQTSLALVHVNYQFAFKQLLSLHVDVAVVYVTQTADGIQTVNHTLHTVIFIGQQVEQCIHHSFFQQLMQTPVIIRQTQVRKQLCQTSCHALQCAHVYTKCVIWMSL